MAKRSTGRLWIM